MDHLDLTHIYREYEQAMDYECNYGIPGPALVAIKRIPSLIDRIKVLEEEVRNVPNRKDLLTYIHELEISLQMRND